MARRRKKAVTMESDSSIDGNASTASTSTSMSMDSLSNDTDAPFIGIYSEDRATDYGLFTMYPHTQNITNLSSCLRACNYPLRITMHPDKQSDWSWCGSPATAVNTILESLPRIVTTPGDLTDTQIRAQIETYFEGIIDLLSMYMPVAALNGYSKEYPIISGYVDTYLASVGAKPWQIRQMQTLWRSLVVPPALVKYLEGYFAVKQHPRVANMHHFIPIPAHNAGESTGSATSIHSFFIERFEGMKSAITDYEEFINLMKLGGYPMVEMPDSIAVSRVAKDYELQVNGGLYYEEIGLSQLALPASGYKARTLSACRYVHDVGPSMARGLTPTYVTDAASGWNANEKSFLDASNPMKVLGLGYNYMVNGPSNSCLRTTGGFMDMFASGGTPVVRPTPGATLGTGASESIATTVSDNAAITTIGAQNNAEAWNAAVDGQLTARGDAQFYLSNTVDPNVKELPSTSNKANLKQVYGALLLPA